MLTGRSLRMRAILWCRGSCTPPEAAVPSGAFSMRYAAYPNGGTCRMQKRHEQTHLASVHDETQIRHTFGGCGLRSTWCQAVQSFGVRALLHFSRSGNSKTAESETLAKKVRSESPTQCSCCAKAPSACTRLWTTRVVAELVGSACAATGLPAGSAAEQHQSQLEWRQHLLQRMPAAASLRAATCRHNLTQYEGSEAPTDGAHMLLASHL